MPLLKIRPRKKRDIMFLYSREKKHHQAPSRYREGVFLRVFFFFASFLAASLQEKMLFPVFFVLAPNKTRPFWPAKMMGFVVVFAQQFRHTQGQILPARQIRAQESGMSGGPVPVWERLADLSHLVLYLKRKSACE